MDEDARKSFDATLGASSGGRNRNIGALMSLARLEEE